MTFPTIRFRVAHGVGEVVLARPAVLNAFNAQMRDDIWQVLDTADLDEDIRVMLFVGAGRAFSAGADLTEFGLAPSQAVAREVRLERDVWDRLRTFPKPMVAAIHGFAIGAGLEIALMCDLRVMGRDTYLRFPEASLGMVPAGGGTQMLARQLGLGRALQMTLRGGRLTATEAAAAGFANRVVAEHDVQRAGRRLARRLARLEHSVAVRLKAAVVDGLDLPLRDGLSLEARLASLPPLTPALPPGRLA